MKKSPLPIQSNCGRPKHVLGKVDLVKLLRWHFGHSDFRGKQLEAIEAVLSGRDYFCLMPTGGGKSMCYQVPALTKPGIVLVVSPLIALMENQVSTLKGKGIPAEFLSSTQTVQVKNKMVEYCEGSGCRRKIVLESFGEMVPGSLCEKSCDACKHPNLVTSYLEQLKTAAAFQHGSGSSRIYMTRTAVRDI